MSAEMECEPSKRRMEDNTTNSEAMTETIAENPNANLSLDSLAQSFVDKVTAVLFPLSSTTYLGSTKIMHQA